MHGKRSAENASRHTRPGILAADRPLVVPMLLRISDLKLRGIVVLVVSKTKGVTLVFKNDPLENILVSSTFDSISSIRNFLQREIEKQIRNLFQEDLPVMIHNLSLRHIQNEQERLKKEEERTRSSPASIVSESLRHTRSSSSCSGIDVPPPHHHLSSSPTPTEPAFFMDQDFTDLYSASGYHLAVFKKSSSSSYQSSIDADIDDIRSLSLSSSCSSSLPDYSPPFSSLHHGLGYYTHPSIYTEYASIRRMHQYLQHWDDQFSESNTTACSSAYPSSVSIADIYADDADAPWYVSEGPEIPSLLAGQQENPSAFFSGDIVLRMQDNELVSRLARLSCAHRTLSPSTPTILNAVVRSCPHPITKRTGARRTRKIPKRRVIRLSGFSSST